MQQAGQEGAKQDRRGQHNAGRAWGSPFQPGQSGNPVGTSKAAREARIVAKMDEIGAEFGGVAALSPGDRVLLRQAAELLTAPRPKSAEDRVRDANVVTRAVGAIRKHRGYEGQAPTMVAALGEGGSDGPFDGS
jgi:hypothetical protein